MQRIRVRGIMCQDITLVRHTGILPLAQTQARPLYGAAWVLGYTYFERDFITYLCARSPVDPVLDCTLHVALLCYYLGTKWTFILF